MTKCAYFSHVTQTKKFLLFKFCDTTAGNESMTCHGRTYEANNVKTDRHECRNSCVDVDLCSSKEIVKLFALENTFYKDLNSY